MHRTLTAIRQRFWPIAVVVLLAAAVAVMVFRQRSDDVAAPAQPERQAPSRQAPSREEQVRHELFKELKPVKLDNTMAFMFETRFPQQLTRFAAELETLQDNYVDCWTDLKKRFNGTPEGDWS